MYFISPEQYMQILTILIEGNGPYDIDIHETLSEDANHFAHYAGKCHLYVWEWIKENPALLPQSGFYDCLFWGYRQHWWAIDEDGEVFDPTDLQFPSSGAGEYIPLHEAQIPCPECGDIIPPFRIGMFHHNHMVCSEDCYSRMIGFGGLSSAKSSKLDDYDAEKEWEEFVKRITFNLRGTYNDTGI